MSTKQKCKLCEQSMRWALPERVTSNNYEYAKQCLRMVKTTLVCGHTMKTKGINHEQYCKHFITKDERMLKFETDSEKNRIRKLEYMIKEYEKENEVYSQ